MSFVGKWIGLEITILNKIDQTQKDKCHVFYLICGILKKYMKLGGENIME
jgi:hypothetical protein